MREVRRAEPRLGRSRASARGVYVQRVRRTAKHVLRFVGRTLAPTAVAALQCRAHQIDGDQYPSNSEVVGPGVLLRRSDYNNLDCQTSLSASTVVKGILPRCKT